MTEKFRLGIDVGGTFTDAVLISEVTGETQSAKVLSSPDDPSVGFLEAVGRVLAKANLKHRDISYLVHGTTVATNALIEGKTPRVAFITTLGFRDMLEIARQIRPSLSDIHFEKPRSPVPRNLCFEVAERLDASGTVITKLNDQGVHEIARELKKQGILSIAVCFLHAYLNGEHEERVAEILNEHIPDCQVSLSHQVCPEVREYFRASTTVINASIRPVLSAYLGGIERHLRADQMEAELLVMQSNGGVLTFASASEKPVYMIESGPAAGVIVANFIASALGYKNVLSFDMGGTTAKVGLILEGRPRVTKEYEVGARALSGVGRFRGSGYPIRTPVIDLVEIGAGGGSVAWIDSGGIVRVGPRSAGASPGPICYGNGGEEPTITDANVVLGRLNPSFFLGGEMELKVDAAAEGILTKCGKPLAMDAISCANGIVKIANAEMTNALRIATLQRGYDPRDLVMVAFGGAGPLHANRLCAEMQIPLLIVPPSPGTASAFGLLVTDLKYEFSRGRVMDEEHQDAADITSRFSQMEGQGREVLTREGMSDRDIIFLRQTEMRYAGQSYELPIDCPNGEITQNDLDAVRKQFHREHERAYGHGYPEQPTEMVTLRLTAIGAIRKPRLREVPADGSAIEAARKTTRPVFFEQLNDFAQTPVYDRGLLCAGHCFEGPAIVEEMDSSTLIEPNFAVEVDQYGNLLISAKQGKSIPSDTGMRGVALSHAGSQGGGR
jgi:N-methylhydantoinase A